ncbi:MAG: MFS transporter, partial [Verrucomicrobiota bacterium]
LGSHALGLIGSLFVVPWLHRWQQTVTGLASKINGLGAVGFFIAALGHGSIWIYGAGITLAMICATLAIPLQTHWLRQNYPEDRRGKLFGLANLVRAMTSVVFGTFGGWLLEQNFRYFPWLLAFFGVCFALSAWVILRIPEPEEAPAPRAGVGEAMKWLHRDKTFLWVIVSAMAMGFGVLISLALRVDYIANDEYGLSLSPTRVAFLTSTLPSIMRLVTTFFWGMLFDRMNFILLRIILNVFFGLSLFFYFWTDSFWVIAIGAALSGIARGGGEIAWNLWVTKLAPPEHVAEYMSVHTFMTGLRAFVAPFLGFWVAAGLGLNGMVLLCLGFVVLAIGILVPFVKTWGSVKA